LPAVRGRLALGTADEYPQERRRCCPEETAQKKLWGRSSRPLCRCLLQVLSAFCCFSSLLSFWLPWIYSPFPFFMEFRNDDLLQLVECIESTQNEVKRKMIEAGACNAVPKSPAPLTCEKIIGIPTHSQIFYHGEWWIFKSPRPD
jgi:hypothetical protein